MKPLFSISIFITSILISISCSTHRIFNKDYPKLVFSEIKTDYSLTDLNSYGCMEIDLSILLHIIQNGTLITEKEVHDHYSTTGCTINGSIKINGKESEFVYDYGGIIYFSDGKILGCGKNCCMENYPYCSWDINDLKGY